MQYNVLKIIITTFIILIIIIIIIIITIIIIIDIFRVVIGAVGDHMYSQN